MVLMVIMMMMLIMMMSMMMMMKRRTIITMNMLMTMINMLDLSLSPHLEMKKITFKV
jgi:hypothetical protein